jgi:MYXO-CTERM domain-containing protein
MKVSSFSSAFLGGFILVTMGLSAHATLLVYADFDYALADNTNLTGAGVGGTGLSGTWANVTGSTTAPFRYDTTGLTFSPNFFATDGGSINLVLGNNQFALFGAALNAGTVTGTLYESYLVNITSNTGTGEGSGIYNRISSAQASSSSPRLSLAPEATPAGGAVGAGYEGTAFSAMTAGTGALSTGTTSLVVGRFTNVGAELTVGNPGQVDLWVFTQAAYNSWFLAGGQETKLGDYATFKATDTATSGTHTFDNSSFLQFNATTTGTGGGSLNVNFDEIRFGTQLTDVMAVPEPSALPLGALGLVALGLTRRRRRNA